MQALSHARSPQGVLNLLKASPTRRYATAFAHGPAPPRLPKEEQELYEKLQRSSTGAFSTPKPTVIVNPSTSSSESSKPRTSEINQSPHHSQTPPLPNSTASSSDPNSMEGVNAKVQATGEGEELHPDVRRGARPDFEGERNPETGEVGGPKNEPLRWGGRVDWSYNGRVTDF
ncbi:MAG: hypothetical protein Q9201_003025 [Fulgogasparrea decipioides]